MATFDTTRTAYGSVMAVSRVTSFVTGVFGAVVAWNDARVTRNALVSLTDRELDDIGLIRGDIDMVSHSDFIR
ncbi:Uncharacterized conserved protein YjiS, DUF1127 family [Sulfitobacter brevis]|uniref:Uncharacterized conserved protein YjiS, DUF1127 family n=1 Tax=Sulfitobacter brevis TaxID=74348 RepID=A0A1I2BKX3_9RHOB|nr:DUF1127 domain-containing protein [Sulfitobacter brevis]SFE56831.1 Uncharacterized conserved protein YjiS, DUF1127 family [Sulfitobacter brevis]